MEQTEGIRNFAVNIKPIMLKIKDGKRRFTAGELQSILQFYLEVVDCLSREELRSSGFGCQNKGG